MKAKLTFELAANAASTAGNLQKGDAQSWLPGGNTVPKDTTPGTKNNQSLKIIVE